AGEYDLEQVGAGAGNRREERVGRLADRQEGADRRKEPVRADHRVPVADRKSEPDRPVDEGRDSEDEHVLAGDVGRVLHPRQPRFEEGEARLHEHHQDRGDDDPDGVGRDQQLARLHPTSSSSSRTPVRLCVTLPTRLVQTSPSPESFPLRPASAIAATTAGAIPSSTTNVSSAFGRKRDSNTRPRYSWVTPRCRPWPIASTTVTPTWPVSCSTASITVSTRSRMTTASTLINRPPCY